MLQLPGPDGAVRGAVLGLGAASAHEPLELWHTAGAPDRLPAGSWYIAQQLDPASATAAALGWAYGGYRFDRYRTTVELARLPPSSSRLKTPTCHVCVARSKR